MIATSRELTPKLRKLKDKSIQWHLDVGDQPHEVKRLGDTQVAVAWKIDEKIARDGVAPPLPCVKEGMVPMSGCPWKTRHNIPFVIISGEAGPGNKIEISRDLLAPARLAAKELGTMEGNVVREQKWYNNLVANRPYVARGEPVRRDRFKGQPVIIAGAGPSLEKHIGLLDDCEFPVLLTNQALQMVNPRGKLYMSIDYAGREKWYQDIDLSETEAVFDVLSAHVGVKQAWKAVRWFRQTYPVGLANEAAAEWYPRLPIFDPGHCVAYAALGVVLWWGADPIIFVGQDFSFGPNLTLHAGEGDDSAKPKQPGQMVFPAENICGEKTTTSQLYRSAAAHVQGSVKLTRVYGGAWAETVPRIINATEGGILDIPDIMPLGDVLEKCRSDLPSLQHTPIPAFASGCPKNRKGRRKRRRYRRPIMRKQWALKALPDQLRRLVDTKDSYWSVDYHGPENPERIEIDGADGN